MTQLKRLINLCRRKASNTAFLEQRYQNPRTDCQIRHVRKLQGLEEVDSQLLGELRHAGIAFTSLEQLALPGNSAMWEAAHLVADRLRLQPSPPKGAFLTLARSDEMSKHPSLFGWGLQTRLLNLLEHYLQLPVAYHGVYLRRDSANTVRKKSRLWHTDMEDDNTIKILIYLHDMNLDRGPFEYLPKAMSDEARARLDYQCGYIKPGVLEQWVENKQWKSCLGTAGTVAIVDTGRLIHRGRAPESSDRYCLFFDYTSNVPRRPYYCKSSLPLAELSQWAELWNEQQQQAVFWRS